MAEGRRSQYKAKPEMRTTKEQLAARAAEARAHKRAAQAERRRFAFGQYEGGFGGPAGPEGTGFHDLRGVRVAYDVRTGAPGNPAGPWKSFDPRTGKLDRFTVPLPDTAKFLTTGFAMHEDPDTDILLGTRADCLSCMTTQFRGQCFLASGINALLAAPEFRALMLAVFEALPAALGPELGARLARPVEPLSVPLPLGFALLQLFYGQYQRTSFQATPALEVVESRMFGPMLGTAGFPEAALATVLSALGVPWAVAQRAYPKTPWPTPKDVPVVLEVLYDPAAVPGHGKHGRRLVGASLTSQAFIIDGKLVPHAVAALDCDLVFDSNVKVAESKWREGPLRDAAAVGKYFDPDLEHGLPVASAVLIHVAPALGVAAPGAVAGVLRACLGTHYYTLFMESVVHSPGFAPARWPSSQLFARNKAGELHGPQILKTAVSPWSALVHVGYFNHGALTAPKPDWPCYIKADKNEVTLQWCAPRYPKPFVLILYLSSGAFAVKNAQYDGDTNFAAIGSDFDYSWLPPRASIPPPVFKACPSLEKLFATAKVANAKLPKRDEQVLGDTTRITWFASGKMQRDIPDWPSMLEVRGQPPDDVVVNGRKAKSATAEITFTWPERVAPLPYEITVVVHHTRFAGTKRDNDVYAADDYSWRTRAGPQKPSRLHFDGDEGGFSPAWLPPLESVLPLKADVLPYVATAVRTR